MSSDPEATQGPAVSSTTKEQKTSTSPCPLVAGSTISHVAHASATTRPKDTDTTANVRGKSKPTTSGDTSGLDSNPALAKGQPVNPKKKSKKNNAQTNATKEAANGSILNWGRETTKQKHQFGKDPPKDYQILRVDFMKNLRKKGYFRSLDPKSTEYQAKLTRAENMFALRHGWRLNVHSMDQSNKNQEDTGRTKRMYQSFNHAFKKSKVSSPRGNKSSAMSMPLRPQRQKAFSLMLAQAQYEQESAEKNSNSEVNGPTDEFINDESLLPTLLARPDENKRKSPRNTPTKVFQNTSSPVLTQNSKLGKLKKKKKKKKAETLSSLDAPNAKGCTNDTNETSAFAGQKRGSPAELSSSNTKNPNDFYQRDNSYADTSDDTSSGSGSGSGSGSSGSGSGSDTDSDSDSDSGSSSIDENSAARISIPGLHQIHPNSRGEHSVSKRKSGLQKWHGSKVETRALQQQNADENTDIKEFLQGKKPGFEWRLGDQIGSGAHGIVYRGLNQNTGALIAVKQIPIDGVEEIQIAIVLQREVDILTDISHPNVVRYFGMEVRDNYLHLMTEYVSGGSIADQLQQFGPMNEGLVKRHTHQILVGLAFLHHHGVVHRDIKGQNVLVSQQGVLKLADFGAAQTFDGIGDGTYKKHALCGTPAFVAPEIILEVGHDDRADIWSLGCTVVQMLTAQTPWAPLEFGSLYELLHHVAYGSTSSTGPPCATPITPTLHAFLLLCFERDKTRRPAAGALLKHALMASFETSLPSFDTTTHVKRSDSPTTGSPTGDNVKVSPFPPRPILPTLPKDTTPEKNKTRASPESSPEQPSDGMQDEDLIGLNANQFDDVGPGSEIPVGFGGCCSCFHQVPSRNVVGSSAHGQIIQKTKTRIATMKATRVSNRVNSDSGTTEEREATYAQGLKARRRRQGGGGSSTGRCVVS